MADSFWLADEAPPFPTRRLEGRVDVAVVGGGVTGCSCALTLAEGGLHVGVREEIRAEYEALSEDGFAAEWLDELRPPLDGRFAGAMRHPGDGSIQPARWVRRLAARAAEAGAELRERSRVESLDELDAEQVVIATDGYTHGLVPALDAAITSTRGRVLA